MNKTESLSLNLTADLVALKEIGKLPFYSKGSIPKTYADECEFFGQRIADIETGLPCLDVFVSVSPDGQNLEVVKGYYELQSLLKALETEQVQNLKVIPKRCFSANVFVKVSYFEEKYASVIYRNNAIISKYSKIDNKSIEYIKNLLKSVKLAAYKLDVPKCTPQPLYRLLKREPTKWENITAYESYFRKLAKESNLEPAVLS